ncbi:hypothetical protein RHGRI_008983 [Rhododendron griersonianum]|uniref:ceramide glucosyltransferase n=1 Tax=Rhododendron griersonianum TaxID=479676 RepID=A0AAV6L5N9_9ERIC|nr:hypothetical protein RHGRI_008983 [Rhododendron griersonianum]
MSPFDSLDAFLIYSSGVFCSPLAIFIQIQGYLICLILAVGWAFAAYVRFIYCFLSCHRSREIRQMKDSMKGGNSFAFLSHDINDLEHSNQVNLPRVTVVMPLKGFGEHNLHNWRTQITSLYGGPLEFHFVVESMDDPAYHALNRLLADFKDDVDAKIIVAGLSTTCSQKIHNQLIGVERMHKDSKYVLFLDDDVRLHPGSIGALTAEMEKNPEIFIQTGYPLDLPSGSLGSYCIYEYHMFSSALFDGVCYWWQNIFPLGRVHDGKYQLLPFRTMHADDFRNNRHEVVSDLRDGGYSDDMTLAAIAGAHKRLITSPPVAVFPHPLASDLSFSRFVLELLEEANICSGIIHDKGLTLAGCLAICTFIELLSMWNLTRIEVQLCNMLSPEALPLSLASYNWCLVFVAMLVDNFLYPISAFRSHFSQSINWSGIRYHLKDGKISKIDRSKDKGPKYTDLGGKRLYGKRGVHPNSSIFGSWSTNLTQWRQPRKFDV